MRVLVTGHHGYIGSVRRRSAGRGPRGRRAGHVLLPGLRLRRRRPSGLRRCSATSATSTPAPRGLRRRRAPGGALERPARRHRPELDVLDQLRRGTSLARGGEGGRGAPLPLRLLVQHVRRRQGDEARRRDAPLRPLTPYAESKVRAEEASAGSPTRTSCRSRCGTPPRTGSRPGCGWTSCSTTSSPGRTRPARSGCSATACRGGRSSTSATSRRRRSRSSTRRRDVAGEAFNIGTTEQNYLIRDLAEIVQQEAAVVRGRLRERRVARPAQLPRRLLEVRRALPGLRARVDGRAGRRRTRDRLRAGGARARGPQAGRRYIRLNQLKHLLADGALDDGLRWKAAAQA